MRGGWAHSFGVVLLLVQGCGAALVLHRVIPTPAAIPARSFPVVYVAASPDDASRDVAGAIVDRLRGGTTRVVRAEPETLLGDASMETTATLALLVSVTLREDVRMQLSQTPTTGCGSEPASLCYGYGARAPIEVHVQVGELLVRAFDPRSAAEVGRAVWHAQESEPSPIAAQLTVVSRLRDAAAQLFDVHESMVDLELDDVADRSGRAAIDAARAGDIHGARLTLEARLASTEIDEPARSALMFDLAQLIRVDVDTQAPDRLAEETSRLALAEVALLAAIRLAPSERHERALTQLRAERTAREDIRAQQAATDTNFGRTP